MGTLPDKIGRIRQKIALLADIHRKLSVLQCQAEVNAERLEKLKASYAATQTETGKLDKIIAGLVYVDAELKAEIARLNKKIGIIESKL